MASRTALPLEDITLHTVCELRDAFQAFSEYPNKKALPKGFPDQWSASVAIAPKVDTDLNTRAGLTGSSRGPNTNTFFNTWTIGSAPGAGIDVKANTNGSVTYYVHAHDLLAQDFDCSDAHESSHALAQDLGIKDWFKRLIEVGERKGLAGVIAMKFDKSSFGAQVTVKTDAASSFTYNFPFGTNFASAGGWYQVDEQLTIAFAYDPPPVTVVQYPPLSQQQKPIGKKSSKFLNGRLPSGLRPYRPQGVSEQAKEKLDAIQTEQLLRGLKSSQ